MNNDWKPTENNISSPWDVNVQENNIGQPTNWKPKPQTPEEVADGLREAFRQAKKDGVMDATPILENWGEASIKVPKQSNWKCYLFGNRPGGTGIVYIPSKGRVPNRFVRFMMRICFDCLWVKNNG